MKYFMANYFLLNIFKILILKKKNKINIKFFLNLYLVYNRIMSIL
jgi:hypothetical protein